MASAPAWSPRRRSAWAIPRCASSLAWLGTQLFSHRRRIAIDHRVIRNVLRYDGTGADHGVRADRQAGQQDGPGADRRALLDQGLGEFRRISLGAWAQVV